MLNNPKEIKDRLVDWIRDYFDHNGPGCTAVVGISGGKDSSVTAALCVEALGKDKVLGVLMPDGIQSDIADAIALVEHLDIKHLVVNIGDTTKALTAAIEGAEGFDLVAASMSRDSIINMPARLRMTTLYAVGQSLPKGGRVANTCNRSEDYVGYSTKYGDAAGDFSPLQNILVEEVRQLGHELGLPDFFINKTPSDGLSGQTDEDKLGFTYAQLDHYILTGQCQDPDIQAKIDSMHAMNMHKLQLMPAFKK
jgi:NAD+ synthetase